MRKTLLVTIDYWPQTGGVANYLVGLVDNLPAQDLVVLAPKAGAVDRQPVKIYRRSLFWALWPKWLPMIWQIYRIAKKEKVEMLWAGQPLPVGTAVNLVSRFLKIPYIVNTHGMDVAGPLAARGRRLKVLKKVLSEAKTVTVNSENTKRLVLEVGIREEKILKIYPCPRLGARGSELGARDLINKFNLNGKKVLLTVGRLVERKGQDMVIRALPRVLARVPDLVYFIAGNGENRDNLLELIKGLNLGAKVVLSGYLANDELAAVYGACNAFIMTARDGRGGDIEGFGTVFLEAGLFGKPVIAGSSGGQAEAVVNGQTGLVVDPENIEDIASAIIKLLTDESLAKRLGEAGKARAEKEFRWEVEAKKLKDLLS